MVIPQVLDENRSLCLILTIIDSSMTSAKVTDKKTTQLLRLHIKFPLKFLAFHRENPIHSYLSEVTINELY